MPPPYPTRSLTMNQVSRYRGALSTQGNRFISISSSLSDSSRRIFYLGIAERSCFDATKLFPD
jgi:hypothetical protein